MSGIYQKCCVAGSLLVAVSGVAAAQCTDPPRLVPAPATCLIGEPCTLSVAIETGNTQIVSVAATLATAADLECPSGCTTGAAAANAGCLVNPQTCQFSVADLQVPLTPFVNGELLRVATVCSGAGDFLLDLDGLSMSDPGGNQVAACAASATLSCVDDPCTLLSDGAACDDGDECTHDACSAGTCVGESRCGAPLTMSLPPVASDVLFTLRASVGLEACLPCYCDVNADTTVTVSDALAIMLAVVGREVELACG